jgi:hypothetical protein
MMELQARFRKPSVRNCTKACLGAGNWLQLLSSSFHFFSSHLWCELLWAVPWFCYLLEIDRMAMSSEVELPVSKKDTVTVGGNLVVNGSAGTGAASTVLRHQLSSVSSIELMATAGLRSVLGVQTSRWEFTIAYLPLLLISCMLQSIIHRHSVFQSNFTAFYSNFWTCRFFERWIYQPVECLDSPINWKLCWKCMAPYALFMCLHTLIYAINMCKCLGKSNTIIMIWVA